MARQYESTETRRRQIAEAALHVIAEGGLRKFTTRAVAERVGITDGTVFRHFHDMDEIVHAALDVLEEELFGADPVDLPAMERLEAFFRHRATTMGRRGSIGRLLFSEQLLHAAGEDGRRRIAEWRHRNLAFVARCLEELSEQGRLAGPLPPKALVPVVQGVLLTFAVQGTLGDPTDEALERRVEGAWSSLRTLLFR